MAGSTSVSEDFVVVEEEEARPDHEQAQGGRGDDAACARAEQCRQRVQQEAHGKAEEHVAELGERVGQRELHGLRVAEVALVGAALFFLAFAFVDSVAPQEDDEARPAEG
jgi:hypothetical protein